MRAIYDATAADGDIGLRCCVHIVFPRLANLYLICTLLATLWALSRIGRRPFVIVTA